MPIPPDTTKTTLIRTPEQVLGLLELLDRVNIRARWTKDVWNGGESPDDLFCMVLVDVDARIREILDRPAARRMAASEGRDRRSTPKTVECLHLLTVEAVRGLAEDAGPVCPGCGEPGPPCPRCECVR